MIQKGIIELDYNGLTDAFALQNEIGELCKNALLPQLETLLDQFALPDRQQKIDRLDIAIHLDESQNWQLELTEKVVGQLKQILLKKIEEDASKSQSDTEYQSFVGLLLHYFEKGFLPWWTPIRTKQEFMEAFVTWVKTTRISTTENAGLIYAFQQPKVVENILQSLPETLVIELMVALVPSIKTELAEVQKEVRWFAEEMQKSSTGEKEIETTWKKQLLLSLGSFPLTRTNSDQFLTYAVANWVSDMKHKGVELPISRFKSPVFRNVLLTKTSINRAAETSKGQTSSPRSADSNSFTSPSHYSPLQKKETRIEDEIYLVNAGLVILAPFLSTLFQRMHILQEGTISLKAKALRVLHYLATGNQDPAPFELVLPKLLCGIPFEEAVELGGELSEEEKNESDELLSSVIEHWSILKETSREGLRESFLKREGKLFFQEKEWRLIVEQKSYDLLLQHLPWNIGLIKLPWMENLLKTEWI